MSNPPLKPRPKAASLFMAAPIVFAGILMVSVALLAFLAWRGGAVKGERVNMQFSSSCMDEAAPIIIARAEEIGLGKIVTTHQSEQLTLTATLPGLSNDKEDIPKLLSRRGTLSILSGQTLMASEKDLKEVSLELDESGLPIVKLTFKTQIHEKLVEHIDSNPSGELTVQMDESDTISRPNTAKLKDEFRLISKGIDGRAQMKQSADRAILLQHGPIPCSVNLDLVTESSKK
jgi:hypothetical protein